MGTVIYITGAPRCGKSAGQSVSHFHIHIIIPGKSGDGINA